MTPDNDGELKRQPALDAQSGQSQPDSQGFQAPYLHQVRQESAEPPSLFSEFGSYLDGGRRRSPWWRMTRRVHR